MSKKDMKLSMDRRRCLQTIGTGVISTSLLTTSIGTVRASNHSNDASERPASRQQQKKVAAEYRRSVRQVIRQEMDNRNSPASSGDVSTQGEIGGSKTVYLGQDATISDMTTGDKGHSNSGSLLVSANEGVYDTSQDSAGAACEAKGGRGTITAWGYIGRTFTCDGSSSQSANVGFYGDYAGSMETIDGTNYVKVEGSVYDYSNDLFFPVTVFSRSGNTDLSIAGTIQHGTSITLEPGNTYLGHVKVTTEVGYNYDDTLDFTCNSLFHINNGKGADLDKFVVNF